MTDLTGCGYMRIPAAHMRIAASHRSYMIGVHLKRRLKYTEKAEVIASRLLQYIIINNYVKQYYSEYYNRDVQMLNLKN